MTIITNIVNSQLELKSFPLNGDLIFQASGNIDLSRNIFVQRLEKWKYPNGSSYFQEQKGDIRLSDDFSYTIVKDGDTYTVKMSGLIPSQEYVVGITNSSIAELTYSEHYGDATVVSVESTFLDNKTIDIEFLSDTTTVGGTLVNSVKVIIGTEENKLDIPGDTIYLNDVTIKFSDGIFLKGDKFIFQTLAINPALTTEIINIKTSYIEDSAQLLEESSKRVNELDLIAFYEENNVPEPPAIPTGIRRVLKSNTKIMIEFEMPTLAADLDITGFVGPAFDRLSLPESEWDNGFKITVRQLSPRVILLSFAEKDSQGIEIVL